MKQGIKRFFAYARARHAITLARAAGLPREKWTKDPILKKYRFTCVFRELDKTTQWYRQNVREKYDGRPEVLLATVLFRMLNRIETGDALFCKPYDGGNAFEKYLHSNDWRDLRRAVIEHVGKKGPYVTGAYIISSPPGHAKLDGMLRVVHEFNKSSREWEGLGAGILGTINWRGEEGAAELMGANPGVFTLESAWEWLRKFDWLGVFHSYEIVTDLRHTYLLKDAPDIMTWASPGPGANRGANRVHGRDKDVRTPRAQLIEEMAELLAYSTYPELWQKMSWPRWEMRDVEHTLCEFDKYERVRLEEGKPRGVYR